MSRRALILAVVVLLIASSMVVLGSGSVRGSPAPSIPRVAPAHPSVSTINLATYDGYDHYYNESLYATGTNFGNLNQYPGVNILYFAVYDPSDAKVTFTVTDPNATRDGLVNPVFSSTVTLNTTTYTYDSRTTGVSFTFPATLKVGGGWNVTATGTVGGTASYPIFVETYFETITGSPAPDYENSVVLPGETITVAYQALNLVNGGLDTAITNVSYNGHYHGANDNYTNLFSPGVVTQAPASLGSYTFTVPANASWNSYIDVAVWASIYNGTQQAENESYSVEWLVGGVYVEFFYIESTSGSICPTDGSDYTYTTGSYVQACALIGAFGGEDQFAPVPGLPVTVAFYNGLNPVTPPGAPTTLTTNATGYVTFSFWANSPQFSSWYSYPFGNSVNLTVTDPYATPVPANNHYIWWQNDTFSVAPGNGSAGVTVGLNQLSYYPGQTITATWSIDATNSNTGPVQAVTYYIVGTDNNFLAQGPISSTASTGTFAVTLPTGYTGVFTVQVTATNATTEFMGQVSGWVVSPTLYLTPSSTAFTPGSAVTVEAQAFGDSGLTSPTITYQVWAEYGLGETGYGGGGLVSSGTVANGSSFTISVPSTGAPNRYYIEGYLTSAGGTAASATLNLYQSWGYNVFVGVSTKSSYSDGSYQPGQTITVTYQISPYGNAPLPTLYTFEVFLGGTQISSLITTSSTSGSVQITIPSGWQTGFAIIEIELEGTYLTGNSCGNGYCSGVTAIVINASPSALSMEIGAGSGLTVGWLILLIIAIVLFLITLVLIMRKRKTPPAGGSPPVSTPMNPPAPAPSGPGAAAWQEPAAPTPASDGQPPMPSPPPGAR